MIQRKIRALCDFTFRSMFVEGKVLSEDQVCTLTFANKKEFEDHLALGMLEEVDDYIPESIPEIPLIEGVEEVEEFIVEEGGSLELTGNMDKVKEDESLDITENGEKITPTLLTSDLPVKKEESLGLTENVKKSKKDKNKSKKDGNIDKEVWNTRVGRTDREDSVT